MSLYHFFFFHMRVDDWHFAMLLADVHARKTLKITMAVSDHHI